MSCFNTTFNPSTLSGDFKTLAESLAPLDQHPEVSPEEYDIAWVLQQYRLIDSQINYKNVVPAFLQGPDYVRNFMYFYYSSGLITERLREVTDGLSGFTNGKFYYNSQQKKISFVEKSTDLHGPRSLSYSFSDMLSWFLQDNLCSSNEAGRILSTLTKTDDQVTLMPDRMGERNVSVLLNDFTSHFLMASGATAPFAIGPELVGYQFPSELQARNLATNLQENIYPSNLKGKIVIMSFWATYCTPCIEDRYVLQKIRKSFSSDVVLINISIDEKTDIQKVQDGLKKYYPINEAREFWDFDNSIRKFFNIDSVPGMLVISPDGIITSVYSEKFPENAKSFLQQMISQARSYSL